MKVHFACSTLELKKYKHNYRAICNGIKKLGHTISRDWLPEAIKYAEGRIKIDREAIYHKVIEAILTSDVMVVEGTFASFGVGYQISTALSKNKPILFLENKKASQNHSRKTRFIDGMKSPLISSARYTLETLPEILRCFFDKNKNGSAVKFNIVLTQRIDNYLDWASFTHKTNKSEFIRRVIQEYMDKRDNRYQNYLKQIK